MRRHTNNRTKKITILDVAKAACVSRTAASYILGKTRGGFAKETVKRVQKSAKDLGYKPNPFARSLRTGRTHLLGLLSMVSPETINHMIGYQLEVGVATEARKHGMDIVRVLEDPEIDSDKGRIAELIENRLIDCLILENPVVGSSIIPWLKEKGIIFVVIGNPLQKDVHSVDNDNVCVGKITAQHLIDLGHKRLAYIAPPENAVFGNERVDGFFQTCEAAGIDPKDLAVVHVENSTAGGYKGMKDVLKMKPVFTGVIAADDYMANGAMTAVAEAGLCVPDDVSIVGCNNDPLPASQSDFLTTVDLNFMNLGSIAANRAVSLLEGQKGPHRTIGEVKFIHRKSSGPP